MNTYYHSLDLMSTHRYGDMAQVVQMIANGYRWSFTQECSCVFMSANGWIWCHGPMITSTHGWWWLLFVLMAGHEFLWAIVFAHEQTQSWVWCHSTRHNHEHLLLFMCTHENGAMITLEYYVTMAAYSQMLLSGQECSGMVLSVPECPSLCRCLIQV